MKRIVTLVILLGFFANSYALNDKIRVGLHVSPGIAWSKPFGNDLQKGRPRFGVNYGFLVEYWFAKNYGLSTGLGGAYDGCNIKGRDKFESPNGIKLRDINEKYSFHYLEIPAYLKLKTNYIKGGNFNVWGQVGATLNFKVSARATYSDSIPTQSGALIQIEKENVLKTKNDVTQAIPGFWTNFFDVRLGAGAGFEYKFDEKSSLLVGLFYHNGFINNIFDKDAKKEPNVMRFMSLRVGVLF
ncbi:MAG TPA: porin family protein [Chitinophagales bacterium]|nr:porin family protein [Chitinophagales bacterium]